MGFRGAKSDRFHKKAIWPKSGGGNLGGKEGHRRLESARGGEVGWGQKSFQLFQSPTKNF